MRNYLAALSASLLISVAPHALAASNTDLSIAGTITPAACTPSFTDGGVIDFGKISAKDLNLAGVTEIGRPRIQLAVACNAPNTFALHVIENRPNTTSNGFFGLGLTDADEKLGHFVPWIFNVVADGGAARPIISLDQGVTWKLAQHVGPTHYLSASALTQLTPIAIKDLSMDLEIRTWIARADSLTLTDEVSIDGSVTFEMMYL